MKKLFYYLSCMSLMTFCLSACSDDDVQGIDDIQYDPNIEVTAEGKVLFSGEWVEAKTDFTEEELKEKLLSQPWFNTLYGKDMICYYDKKHWSADSLFGEAPMEYNYTPQSLYFVNDSVLVIRVSSRAEDLASLDALAKDPKGHYSYVVKGNTITVDAQFPTEMFPRTYTVVGFNENSIFVDAPVVENSPYWRRLKTFNAETTTERIKWGEIPQ